MEIRTFDFSIPAELFIATNKYGRRPSMTYRRFATAALAIQFSMEQQSGAGLHGTTLEADGQRFLHRDIRTLYDSAAYPLQRSTPQLAEVAR